VFGGMGQSAAPTAPGGLGVPDLRLQGIALRTRWLWLRFSDSSHPWASLPRGEDRLTTIFFRSSVQFQLGDGAVFWFWTDPWLQG
jgi:hypothetical protein